MQDLHILAITDPSRLASRSQALFGPLDMLTQSVLLGGPAKGSNPRNRLNDIDEASSSRTHLNPSASRVFREHAVCLCVYRFQHP